MEQPDICIHKVNESYIEVTSPEKSTIADLNSYFTFYSPNYQFHPNYKKFVNGKRLWDGKVRLYSTATNRLYAGLLRYVLAFSQERNLKVEVQDNLDLLNNFSLAEAEEFFKSIDPHSGQKSITAHPHQILGLAKAIRYKRVLLVSPTASGKSLMMYGITRYLLKNECKRGLIVVPTTGLVEQMYTDFIDYSNTPKGQNWSVESMTQKIYEGYDSHIEENTQLVISTWQSIYNQSPKWFEQFDFVLGDEAHGFKAESLKTIMTHLVNARYRIGTTGTLDGTKIHRMVIEGHFGPSTKLVTTKELQDKGVVAKLKIKALILKHKEINCSTLYHQLQQLKDKKDQYKQEIDWLVSYPQRNKFIKNLVSSLKGNKMVLFNFLEHGKELYDLFADHEHVFLVNGGTQVEQREFVRKIAEKNDNVVIIASYGVFSTGVSIKNLNHIVFASPSKSKIRVLQSIGRGLRVKEGKEFVTLYDIADDLRHLDWINHTLKHYVVRLKYYKEEDWKVSSYIIKV